MWNEVMWISPACFQRKLNSDIGPQEESRDPGAKSRREKEAASSQVSLGQVELPSVPSVRVVLHGDSSACPWGRFSQTMRQPFECFLPSSVP